MKKTLLLIFLFITMGTMSAQNTESVPLPKGLQNYKERTDEEGHKLQFQVGGGINFGVGGNALQFQISPHFGLLPAVDWLCVGVGGTYELYYFKDYSTGLKSCQHVFGARGFLEGYIWKRRIIVHGEYEWLSYPDANRDGIREQSHAVLIGPGYQQWLNDNLSIYTIALFPVYEPSTNPINAYSVCEIRIGVNYKF